MPKLIEITPAERAKLGRETLLQWSIKENKAKLGALRKEISDALKSGATDKIKKLREIIIRNTRKDLNKIKDLTDAQKDKKAKEFADKVIRYVKENKDFKDVFFTSRFEIGPELVDKPGNDRERLFEGWENNNSKGQIEVLDADPKYLALKEIDNLLMKKEAYLLLSLIEKYWSRKEAMKQYKACWKGNKFYMMKLSSFFTKAKAGPEMGIYFGTRKISWSPKLTWIEQKMFRVPDEVSWWHMKGAYKITGWWAVDADEPTGNVVAHKGKRDFKKVLANIKGDEFLGKYLLKSIKNVKKELMTPKGRPGYNDSGLSPEQEKEVTEYIEKIEAEARGFSKSKTQEDLLKWFKKQPRNKWIALDKEHVGPMCYLYGDTCGKYLYRVTKDRIYAIGIEGETTDPQYGRGSYINIKNNKLGTWWGGKDGADSEKMLRKELLDQMTDAEVKKELARMKVENKAGSHLEKLQVTQGICFTIAKKLTKNVEHNKIKDIYIDKLKIEIKRYLIKRRGYKNKEELAEELAAIRAEHVQKQISEYIEESVILNKAVEDNDKEKLIIEINTSDEVTVELFHKSKLKALKAWAKKKAEGVKTTAKDVAKGTMARLEKKLEKYFGPITPVIMWFLDKFFKVGDMFKKMARGGTSLIGGLLTSVLGLKISRDILKSKKITQELIEKLPPKKKKYYKFNKKMYFSEEVKLKNKKIVIPKGKGIKPGKKFEVKVKGIRDKVTVLPFKEKRGSLWGIFGRKREQYRLQEEEITIPAGTRIPKGTVIPKGAKIFKA